MQRRIFLEALNVSLKDGGPDEAERLIRDLPGRIARRVARLDVPAVRPGDLTDRVARQVATELRRRLDAEKG